MSFYVLQVAVLVCVCVFCAKWHRIFHQRCCYCILFRLWCYSEHCHVCVLMPWVRCLLYGFFLHWSLLQSRLWESHTWSLALWEYIIWWVFFEYPSETSVLKENMINKLMTFERKIMRKLFGPTRTDDGCCRIKTNQEINNTLKGQNIIGFIKKQRLNWLGHVERMTEDNIVQKIKRWKPMSKRPIGRPKTHWVDKHTQLEESSAG